MSTIDSLAERCRKLGIACDEVSTSEMNSALATLCCFPMYMVANVDAWTKDTQFKVPIIDLPGWEHIREAFALGRQERKYDIDREHRRVLSSLISNAKASDLVIYEYALDALALALANAPQELADQIRTAIAGMIVAVAKASGEGLLGSGPKVSPYERDCIEQIDKSLQLSTCAAAKEALAQLDE